MGVGPFDHRRHVLDRDPSHGMQRSADENVGAGSRGRLHLLVQCLDTLRPARSAAVAEALLRPVVQRCPVGSRTEITGIEQRQAKACIGGTFDQRVPHRVWVGVPPPAGVVMQIVELTDRGDPRKRHLGVNAAGQQSVQVGIEPVRGPVHQIAPRPERSTIALRTCPQRSVECMRMGVGHARYHQAIQTIRRCIRSGVGP